MADRAGIYARISDDREGAGLGVARQEEDCRQLCTRLGWTVHRVYTDNDTSAYSGRRRPGYQQLLADLADGTIDAVVAWHPDRLHRAPIELEHFIATVEAAKAAVATVTAGTYDLATPSGRMVARTLGNAARYESEHKAERIRRKHMEIAAAGRRHGGGTRQFGYDDERSFGVVRRVVDDEEAELLRDAARRVLAGDTVRSVCSDWNARGIQTVTGRPWTQTVLKRALIAPSAAGFREHHGAITKGDWPAIIDERTHRRLRTLLLDPQRRTNVVARRYLLSGLLHCARCDARMVARPRQNKKRAYVCATGPGFSGCGHMYVIADPLEAEVAARLFARVGPAVLAVEVAALRTGVTEDDALAEVAALESQLEEGAALWASGAITAGEWVAARQGVERRLQAARKRLVREVTDERVATWAGREHELEAWWHLPTTSLHQRRSVLAGWVESVAVGPSTLPRGTPRFDPNRVHVTWRA